MGKYKTKLLFKIANWLYNKGIIAPQILNSRKIELLNDEELEDRIKSRQFWDELSNSMKNEYLGHMRSYGAFNTNIENITDEQILELWFYAT